MNGTFQGASYLTGQTPKGSLVMQFWRRLQTHSAPLPHLTVFLLFFTATLFEWLADFQGYHGTGEKRMGKGQVKVP